MLSIYIPFDYGSIDYHYQTLDLMLTAIMGQSDIYIDEGFTDLTEDKPYLKNEYRSLKDKADLAMRTLYRICYYSNIEEIYMDEYYLVGAEPFGNSTCLHFKHTEE